MRAVLVQRAEVGQCVAWGWFTWLVAAVALHVLEGGLNQLMALLGMNFINADSGYFNTGSAWDTWRSLGLAARAFNLAWLSYFGTNLDTLIMYHILLQPINFSQFNVLRVRRRQGGGAGRNGTWTTGNKRIQYAPYKCPVIPLGGGQSVCIKGHLRFKAIL